MAQHCIGVRRWRGGVQDNGAGTMLVWRKLEGAGPTVVFLPGFRSAMTGDKATALAGFCAERGQAMLLFDYSGHGESGGDFIDGTVGRWTADALAVIDAHAPGEVLLVGSSMGGWIGLLAAAARPGGVAGFVGIAAAPDFTEALMWDALMPAERERLLRDGVLHVPSAYGEPVPITLALIEDGRRHLVMAGPVGLRCPVRLLHGQADPDVPWQTSLRLAERIEGADVRVHLVKDGDHRLSRPADLALLRAVVSGLLGGQDGA